MATELQEVIVYDRRTGDIAEKVIDVNDIKTFFDFKQKLGKELKILPKENFVICTTNREEINDRTFGFLENRDTLYVLSEIDQELPAQTEQKVEYLPHYDTLVKSGTYEYYASEGQNPLPYAFAELIDNSLGATVQNIGSRHIELRLVLDDSSAEKSFIFVIDNGCGMSSWELNNWAVYRLSKFIRTDKTFRSIQKPEGKNHNTNTLMPRSLNSEISYFGVGGKQAIFFIGQATRMITKPKDSKDVHELCISKEEFEKKEKNKEFVYSGVIRNRKPGDASHIPHEEIMKKVIAEEIGKDSFTCVAIWGICPDHVQYLKHNYRRWCTQLAHIYHYYVHGPNGNVIQKGRVPSPFKNIDIEVKMSIRGGTPKITNLRDIEDDLQSQFIRTATNTFDFRATVDGTRIVEGVLRYHPFLYDHETFPPDAADPRVLPEPEDDHDYFQSDTRLARGRRPIFECYWNGRLIPYSTIDEFEWCSAPKKAKSIPIECYNRVSGVLWTNDSFQVSTNKLTFLDLENKLRDKNAVFTRVIGGQEKRANIDKQFTEWLQQCHEKCDKQVIFRDYQGLITRTELHKHKQYPWAVYHTIEWDGKIFKKDQLVRTQRTVPIIVATVKRFLLYGDHEGDVYATGGDIELQQEPRTLYDEVKIFPLAKLDRKITDKAVRKCIEEEEEKLPDKLIVTWPEGDELFHNEKRPAGKTIGAIKVEISNRRGELISKLPGSSQKKLLVELKIIWHSPAGDNTVAHYQCHHAKNWPYWFRKMETVKHLGPHTLFLQAMLNEGETVLCCGRELPSHKIKFIVTEAEPEKFTVGVLDGPFRVGSPFQIPLEFQDKFGNPTKPSNDLKPILKAVGLDLNYDITVIKGNTLVIKGIIAKGSVESSTGKNFMLSVKIPGLEEDTQNLKIRLLPGPPHKLLVIPEKDIEIENGSSPEFEISTIDMAGNSTCEPKLIVTCKFIGSNSSSLPMYSGDLSTSGKSKMSGPPLHLKNMFGGETLTAKFDVINHKEITAVTRNVTIKPSHKAASIQVSYIGENGERVPIQREKDIIWPAGDIINNLEYEIFDEGGRPIAITQKISQRLKVNWTAQPSRDLFSIGKLPDIETPQSVKQTMYCSVSLSNGHVIDFGFTVKPKHGDPSYIKAVVSGKDKVRIGEVLQSDILVTVSDKHGNPYKKLSFKNLADLLIIADGIDYTHLEKAVGQTGGFVIKGIRFEDGKLGSRELCIQWNDLKDYVRLEMIAGPPAKLIYPNFNTDQLYTLYHENKLPHSLVVQLCDSAGNPCAESNVKVQLGIDEGLKVSPNTSTHCIKTNSEGKVDFGVLTISVRSNQQPGTCPNRICTHSCRGIFSLCAKAFFGRTIIMGPLIKLHMPCDPTKPVSLNVDYDQNFTYTVGKELPDYTVQIMAEDGSIVRPSKSAQIFMKIWKSDSLQNKNMKPFTFAPDMNPRDLAGVFRFRGKKAPEMSGKYIIQFYYECDNQIVLTSSQISVFIAPDYPVKMTPLEDPSVPTVSNTQRAANRCLVRHLRLELKDQYDNLAGLRLNGTLNVQITAPTPGEIPRMVGNVTSIEVPISRGQAFLEHLTILENTPGVNGKEYILRCTPNLPDLPLGITVPPYDIHFLFYNEAQKQMEMGKLAKERDQLLTAKKTYETLFETTEQLLSELETAAEAASKEEIRLRNELKKSGIGVQPIQTISQINATIEKCQIAKNKLEKTKRRECSLTLAADEPGVLGKIGHLAFVEDDDIARVMSWHMQSDMDCLITHSMSKARELHSRTNGQQQVLPLDSIYKKNIPDWGKSLPHCKIRSYNPSGHPVYARDLLIFPKEPESCKIVFGMLLGDTIVLDTLDDATSYREHVVKHCYCPTLLTRTGERIRSNGKFGGQQNRAPPIERMKGVVFGQPPSKELSKINSQITLLETLKHAVERNQQAQKDLQEQKILEKTPEMIEKVQEFNETKERLQKIEEKLGMSSSKTSSPVRVSPRGLSVNMPPELRSTPRRGQTVSSIASSTQSKQSSNNDMNRKKQGIDYDNSDEFSVNESSHNINGVSTRSLNSSIRGVSTVGGRRRSETPARGSPNKRRRKT